jgi:chaperonin GroEL (HSP60 family)
MQTKLVRKDSDQLADIIVKSVLSVAEKEGETYQIDIDDIKVEKKAGGSIKDSAIIQGIVLDKEIVHGGMPKKITEAKIVFKELSLIKKLFMVECQKKLQKQKLH